MRNASQRKQRVLFILWSRVCVCSCVLYFWREIKQRLVKGEIFYYNVLSMRHFGSRDNPRSHPLVHHYTETKMHPMLQKDSALTSRVKRNARVRLGKEAEELRCPVKNSLACVCYKCVKKIVARGTHGEVINMKALISRNKTMTPPPHHARHL